MKHIKDILLLSPHGAKLRTASARVWLFFAGLLVFLMALSESIAWGYMGSLFGDGVTRWFTAAITGLIVFAVIFVIDASLVELDRAHPEHSVTISTPESAQGGARVPAWVTITLRIAVLICSMTITAPYLAELVFSKDIAQFQEARANENIDRARSSLVARYDKAIQGKNQEAETKRTDFERECAGHGLSGVYGCGPASRALLTHVDDLEAQRDGLLREKTEKLNAFNDLAKEWRKNREKLASLYNISLPSASPLENRAALSALESRPEIKGAEVAVKGFLALLFTGLLLLKLYEPTSIRLYFSELLQMEYMRYLAGAYDDALHPNERSSSPYGISPQRFYDFLRERRQDTAALALEEMLYIRNATVEAVDALKEEHDRVGNAHRECDAKSTRLTAELSRVSAERDEHLAKHEELVSAPAVTLDEQGHFEFRTHLRRKIAEFDGRLGVLRDQNPGATDATARARAKFKDIEAALHQKQTELDEVDAAIRDFRTSQLASARHRAISSLETFKTGAGASSSERRFRKSA